MHAGLISCFQKFMLEVGVVASTTLAEARGIRGPTDNSRLGDIVVLDYVAPDKHLLLDGVVTTA